MTTPPKFGVKTVKTAGRKCLNGLYGSETPVISVAHEGKESSLQTQSGISHPWTCMQCVAYGQGWKEATLI